MKRLSRWRDCQDEETVKAESVKMDRMCQDGETMSTSRDGIKMKIQC